VDQLDLACRTSTVTGVLKTAPLRGQPETHDLVPSTVEGRPVASFRLSKPERYPMSLKNSINHLPPERMTPEQRRMEIASILAKGLVRMRQSNPVKRQIPATERKVLLGFSGDQSVHTDLINK
jgi:hypothetical protein